MRVAELIHDAAQSVYCIWMEVRLRFFDCNYDVLSNRPFFGSMSNQSKCRETLRTVSLVFK